METLADSHDVALGPRRPSRLAWAHAACRATVGAALIHAAIHPLGNRQTLVLILNAYRVLPGRLLLPVAIILPYVEIAVGVLLILGLFTRPVAIWASTLIGLFVTGLIEASLRGLQISCGCDLKGDPRSLISLADILIATALFALAVLIALRPRGVLRVDNLRRLDAEDPDDELWDEDA